MLNIKRAIVFVHYDRDNLVDDYVYFYLQALRQHSNHLVFITTSVLSKEDHQKLSNCASCIIERENIGYDFMSYKIGIESFNYADYDELLICNDSVYGPFYSLTTLFAKMQHVPCDFWGITANDDIEYHLQSYFLVFKKTLLSNAIFSTFWDNVKILDSKEEIIEKYEVGLTTYLNAKKFTSAVAIDFQVTLRQKFSIFFRKLSPKKIFYKLSSLLKKEYPLNRIGKINTTLYFWKILIVKYKMPFIKIKLLRDNPNNINIDTVESTLKNVSDYNTGLIKNHLQRMKEKS